MVSLDREPWGILVFIHPMSVLRSESGDPDKAVIVDGRAGMFIRLGRMCLKGDMGQPVLIEVQRSILEVKILA